jgi:hypothetical protein
LRRRIIVDVLLAVILLAVFVVVLRFAMLAAEFHTAVTAERFEAARGDHSTLRAFLHRMPKGGDLHTHLSGAVYAERFVAWAAEEELCVDPANILVAKALCNPPGTVPVSDAMRDQALYDRLVNAFSMRAFLPTPAVPTGHDQFFATFDKFNAATAPHFADMVVDQLRQYDRENVQYGLDYRTLKAIARNALIHSFLDADKKREELQRFDRACADFERSVAGRQTSLQNVATLLRAAVTAPP